MSTLHNTVNDALAALVSKGGSIQINLPDSGYVKLCSDSFSADKPYIIIAQRRKGSHINTHGRYATFDIAQIMLPRIATVLTDYKEVID